MTLDECPDLLTLSEATVLLRISRTKGYAEAKRYERTGQGLPVVRIGQSLRVPKDKLKALIDGSASWDAEA